MILFLFLVLHYCGLDPSTSTSNSEKKRRADDLSPPDLKKRRWTVNGPIRFDDVNKVYYVDPADHDKNKEILQSVFRRDLVMLIGARASGKTTRLYRLIPQLADFGYRCLPLSFEGVAVDNNESDFWRTFGNALRRNYKVDDFTTHADFLDAFSQIKLQNEKIVILIDEFDELFKACDEVRNNFLRALRDISKNNVYAIHSVIVCGTFSLQRLRTTDQHISPFHVNNTIRNPYFTLDQTQQLFNDYAKDEMIKIDDEIIRDIHSKSNGHPGMICLCGRSIHEYLRSKVNDSTNCLDYDTWQVFSTHNQNKRMFSYHTFRRMVDSLLSESATDAVNLLRTDFIGYLGDISITDMEQQGLADFLTAEGVLIRLDDSNYRMASAFIDSFVRRYIIPSKYPNAPSESPPKEGQEALLNILETMKIALRFFDKNLIMQAGIRSYKRSGKTVKAMGRYNAKVPRESVYDTELMRVLTNWLNKIEGYEIIGQWHLRELEDHKYSDIVIKKAGEPTVVIELLATGSQSSIKDHISKTSTYKRLLPAEEAWVVHFTCEDDYFKHPYWQTDAELDQGVNLVHFWHDRDFNTVRMSARRKDSSGNTKRIENELLTV
ncbi:P-loop containing nucleoside triphosphate hydrolase protein [Lobosporangium transversale]|uniref:p-loop containing nucleoside triphosphate hydrolase protein n=1 Tax=Lobosporangium transversale TaxID=64571 RepID=A0A1Y2GE14_9FUNG|nr:P-loop containing nucleoside triphosphate hydrolase protein [Lobosporangium transversale]ORZ08255.1 P-loop containing nucleoside triphosphate hydrolase protein [Lobosporangium transversale]|eukprot:XP_021878338.1 P-loop containing nucleoside triphosphate hydrolase protein [Lobosporangium transversale]